MDAQSEVESLNAFVVHLMGQARYDEAIEVAKMASRMSMERLGEEHPLFGVSLTNFGIALKEAERFRDARAVLEDAVKSLAYSVGPDDSRLAIALGSLGLVCAKLGDFRAAEPLDVRSCAIHARSSGLMHVDYAASLNNLGLFYQQAGRYDDAEAPMLEALRIAETSLGSEHPTVAFALNNLALLYRSVGRLSQAEPLYRRAFEIRQRATPDHPFVVTILLNMARLYVEIGDTGLGQFMMEKAVGISLRSSGPAAPATLYAQGQLAGLLARTGELEEAERILTICVEGLSAAQGADHPDVGVHRLELAKVQAGRGNAPAGLRNAQLASESYARSLGETHPQFGQALAVVAHLQAANGDNEAALDWSRRSLAVLRGAVDAFHPLLAASLRDTAVCAALCGEPRTALDMLAEAQKIEDRHIGEVFGFATGEQRVAWLQAGRHQLESLLTLAIRDMPGDAEAAAVAFRGVLTRKALDAEALASQRYRILEGAYPDLAPLVREHGFLRAQIADAMTNPAGDAAESGATGRLMAERDRIERELALRIPEVRLEGVLGRVDIAAARDVLGSRCLIEYVKFNVAGGVSAPDSGPNESSSRYAAFVIVPDGTTVDLVDLGDSEIVDQLVDVARQAITDDSPDIVRDSATRLRELVWDPVVTLISDHSEVVIALDGELSRIPFQVLPVDGGYLVDAFEFTYIVTGRDLISIAVPRSRTPSDPVVAADPDFELSADPQMNEDVSRAWSTRAFGEDFEFPPLPGTREEGVRVAARLGVEPVFGAQVVERWLKSLSSPRILHLATHGYFLDSGPNSDQGWRDSRLEMFATAGHVNPLLRCGLALAGANSWLRGAGLPAEAEDALLTAEDVLDLDLMSTELVVLSACETGLGQVRAGEGVLGLQRSLIVAGARSVLMSLWSVPDAETAELMDSFYAALAQGRTRSQALREAQIALRARDEPPWVWGGFVCLGDSGPMAAGRVG